MIIIGNYEKHCKTCPPGINCCIFPDGNGFTFIGIRDAERIKRYTGKGFSEFLDYSPLEKKQVASMKADDPALEGALRYSLLDKNGRLLRLKVKNEGRCIFLEDTGKCSIYEIRPNICRIYPFWAMRLTDNSLKVIEHDPEPGCGIISGRRDDPGSYLSEGEIEEIKNTFRKIEGEASDYKKSITAFVKKHFST